jgi:hypothetical protein
MTQLSDITSIHWQPKLGGDGVVTNYDDSGQCDADGDATTCCVGVGAGGKDMEWFMPP